MLRTEVDKAVEGTAAKLNQTAVPPVRRWVLEYVLWKEKTDPALTRAIEECKTYRPLLKLLESQRPDGTWPISTPRRIEEEAGPGPPYGWTQITMVRNLYMLFEYWATRDMGHIEDSLELLLSWQGEDGLIRGPERDDIPRPYNYGLTLGAFLKFGMKGDMRVERLLQGLLKLQRHDGGWNIPYIQDMRYLPDYKYMKRDEFLRLKVEGRLPDYDPSDYEDVPSCIWTTLGALRGISMYRSLTGEKRVKKAAEFVLDRFFKRNHHSSYYMSEHNWTMLKFPTYYGSGLTALDTLVHLGFGPEDERMEKPIKWLLGARAKDGLWHRSERPHPLDDQWISLVSLEILGQFRDLY
ncbi:MAG: hypothetical protein AB7S97_02110 [Thermoplasmata archaeon]